MEFRGRFRRSSRTVLLAAVLSLAVAGTAGASTVSTQGGVLLVAAAPGETNQVEVAANVPPGSDAPSDYTVLDPSAPPTAGPGCRSVPEYGGGSYIVCSAAGVQSVDIRLGDGDDSASDSATRLPVTVSGEAGNDRITLFDAAGSVADGGEGNDFLQAGDDLRGGPGDDQIMGSRLLDGGDGNDVLHKDGTVAGRITAGAGDDSLDSGDGTPDELQCGEGRDVITSADPTDQNDGSCESGTGVKPPPPAVKPHVTVFELPKGRTRPRHGSLKVWMRCTVPNCKVTVRILFVGDRGTRGYVRFRKPPAVRLTVGATAKLFSLRLNRAQRRGLRKSRAYSSLGATVITRRPGPDDRMLTDGFFCRRADPCTDSARR